MNYNDFLGQKTKEFDSEFCTISVVEYDKAVSEEWHLHENFHLSAILSGGNLESRKTKEIAVTPGELLVYQPGEIHRNRHTRFPSKNINVEIKEAFFETYEVKPDVAGTYLSKTSCYFDIIKLSRELLAINRHTREAIHSSLIAMFSAPGTSPHLPPWLQKVEEMIHCRWEAFVSLDEIAVELGVHPVTISKYFRKYYGCTLADYMRKIKVEKALRLMSDTTKPFTEIAFICGFSDQSHMIRAFKSYLGFTPKEIGRL